MSVVEDPPSRSMFGQRPAGGLPSSGTGFAKSQQIGTAPSVSSNTTLARDICLYAIQEQTDHLQTGTMAPDISTHKHLESKQLSTLFVEPSQVRQNNHGSHVTLAKSRPSERTTATPWSTGGRIEVNGQAPSLLSREKTREPLLGFAKKTKGASDTNMRDVMKGQSDYLGFGMHGAQTHRESPRVDHEYCLWVEQVEDQQSHRNLKRFSSWLKMQSAYQEPTW